MHAGRCRGIYSGPHARCQTLHHTCQKGDNYAKIFSVIPLHLGRASTILASSSLQANLLIVGCVGFLFMFQYRGRELKWEKQCINLGIYFCLTIIIQ